MRLYLYLLIMIMFTFTSCKVNKYTSFLKAAKKDFYELDSSYYEYGYESEGLIVGSAAPAPMRGSSFEYFESEEVKEPVGVKKSTSKKISTPKKLTIINNIDSLNLEKGNGVLTYQIPEKLTYGETYIFKLRISSKYKININNLLIDKKNIPISNNPEIGPIILEDIKTSEYMSANLWGDPNGFEISSLNTLRQRINGESFTEWSWKVKPIKSGNFYIKLSINIDDIDHNVYEKDMMVHISVKDRIYLFIMANYEWLWSTLVIPFLLPWIKRKFLNKQNEN